MSSRRGPDVLKGQQKEFYLIHFPHYWQEWSLTTTDSFQLIVKERRRANTGAPHPGTDWTRLKNDRAQICQMKLIMRVTAL